ncbi:MAG: DUF502 domain-containing protein [Spongiibacteraceae bacterium]
MKKVSQLFLQGLFAILPIAVTLAVLYWLGAVAESTLGEVIKWLLPSNWYWPGMGLIAGFVFIFAVGVLLNAYVFQRMASALGRLVEAIPIVKIIYNSVRDISKFASASDESSELKKAVVVQLVGEAKLIGFVTNKSISLGESTDLVAVYLPMSYQISGYTVMLPESQIEVLDMSVQDAMRIVLTAAMAGPKR